MKKKYIIPQMQTVLFRAPVVMLGGSNNVNGMVEDTDAVIGDEP